MSAAFRTRVGKVRYRDGRELRVLPSAEPLPAIEKHLIASARKMATQGSALMQGYVLVSWDAQGFNSSSWQLDPSGFIGKTMMPSFVADVIRSRLADL